MSATSSRSEWRIERATRANVSRNALALEALDAELRGELGDAYSEEPWGVAAFTAERPEKWRLSRLAFVDDRVRGFWIASRRGRDAHTHRVGVHASCRRLGIFRSLAESVHEAARAGGARRITLFVSPANVVARRAYKQLGYTRCELNGREAMVRVLCE